jgi:hypothetical protein
LIFIIKKVDRKTYHVKNKFSGVVRAERSSYSAAQTVANELNRAQSRAGAEYARVIRSRKADDENFEVCDTPGR